MDPLLFHKDSNTMAIWKMESEMELANNFGLIMDSMKENGKMMFRMEEEGT